MPRPNRPWFRADRGEWYMTIDGVKTRLRVFDPDDCDGAVAAAESLRGAVQAEAVRRGTLAEAVDGFKVDQFPSRSEATRYAYTNRLRWAFKHFGSVPVESLDPKEVEKLAAGERWTDSTKRLTLTCIQVVVRWAGRKDFTLDMPRWGRRDEQCVLSRGELESVLAECKGDFGPLVRFLFLTGCRPTEGRTVTADMVRWDRSVVVLEKHKTRHATGRAKTVHLSESALAVLEGQRVKYKTGHLFRREDGLPYRDVGVVRRWARIRKKLGLRSQVVPYSLRHSFATHLLELGESSRDVAELLGHTSTAMVEQTYGHFVNPGRLRSVAGKLG